MTTLAERKALVHDDDVAYQWPIECPVCDGEPMPMGTLGKYQWFRCRGCGMDFRSKERVE